MDRIDLHTHSTASDGSMTPSELVHHAASCGLRAVALTDHDTTVGLTEAQQAANEIGIELVHGVELATWLDKTEFHIVGLDINENNPHFQTAMVLSKASKKPLTDTLVTGSHFIFPAPKLLRKKPSNSSNRLTESLFSPIRCSISSAKTPLRNMSG